MLSTNSKPRLTVIPLPRRTSIPKSPVVVNVAPVVVNVAPPVVNVTPLVAVTVPTSTTVSTPQKARQVNCEKGSCYFWEFGTSVLQGSGNIYAFDLDGTLIKTDSGKRFAQDAQDWQFWHPIIPTKLIEFLEADASILIITNQKGVSSGKTQITDIFNKINTFIECVLKQKRLTKELSQDRFALYVATDDTRFRKPYTGIWDLLPVEVRNRVKYYCGDACGRPGDHSSTDRYFAQNVGIPFYTPEQIFLNQASPSPNIIEVYPAKEFINRQEYSTISYKKSYEGLLARLSSEQSKIVCIMVGAPGSGKSSLSKSITKHFNDQNGNMAIHIERDALGGVQKKFLSKIEASLLDSQKKYIIADATHPNTESRLELITLVERHQKLNWKIIIVHVEAPIELTEHLDACRVQLKISEKPLPTVVFRTFYKRFREDEPGMNNELNKNRWITFTGVNPVLAELPEYSFCY